MRSSRRRRCSEGRASPWSVLFQPRHQLRAVAMFVSPSLLGELVYVRSFIALIVLAVLFFVARDLIHGAGSGRGNQVENAIKSARERWSE